MHMIATIFQETLMACLLLAPIFWYLNQRILHNSIQAICYLVFATYLCAVYVVVGLPDIEYYRFFLNINLDPFLYMFTDMRSTILNVILFVPLGMMLPILWVDFRSLWKSIGFGLFISIIIEVLQIFTLRATDINDLMTNTFGTLLGYWVGRVTLHFIPSDFPSRRRKEIALVFGTAFGVMYFFHPAFSRFLYQLMK